MSTLKVDGIRSNSASSDAITLASDGTCTANITNNLSNRNMIINGAMLVAQRGDKTGATNHYGGCDRFKFSRDGATAVTLKRGGSGVAIASEGFPMCQHIDVTSADTSMGGTNYNILSHRLEGQDLIRIKKGTSNALPVTISFWIKSTITGTYILELADNDNSRSCSKAYSVSSSNTWEKKEITFPADTTGAFDNDTNLSLEINWWLGAGPTYTSGTLQDTWGTQTNANRAVGCVNAVSSADNNIYLTGVQMEVGSIATDFEHRSFAQELALCERYYQDSYEYHHINAQNGESDRWIRFRTEMRASPSVTTSPTNSVSFGVHVASSNGFSGDGSGGGHSNWNLGWTASAEL